MDRDWNFIIGYLRCAKRFYCIDWEAPCLACLCSWRQVSGCCNDRRWFYCYANGYL